MPTFEDMSAEFNAVNTLAHEVSTLQVLNKNKSYTAEFDYEIERADGTNHWTGRVRISLRVMNGAALVDDSQQTIVEDVYNTAVDGQPQVETAMVQLVRQYMKL